MKELHLKAEGIRRGFQIGKNKIQILRGIDLEIYRGEQVYIVGASGAGKTTLLYTLAGMECPDAGEVYFENVPLYESTESVRARFRSTKMGFVFQGYFLLPELTALENVLLPGKISGTSSLDQAREWLERVGLKERMDHLPTELSGGEQQRVAIARALVHNPSILYADEPTGNLDSKTGMDIMGLLSSLARQDNKTLLIVTHDQSMANSGDRKILIQDGQISMTEKGE